MTDQPQRSPLPFLVAWTLTGNLTHLVHVRFDPAGVAFPSGARTLCGRGAVRYSPTHPIADVECRPCLGFAFVDRYHRSPNPPEKPGPSLPADAPFALTRTRLGYRTHLIHVDETGRPLSSRTVCGHAAYVAPRPDQLVPDCRQCLELAALPRYRRPPNPTRRHQP